MAQSGPEQNAEIRDAHVAALKNLHDREALFALPKAGDFSLGQGEGAEIELDVPEPVQLNRDWLLHAHVVSPPCLVSPG